MSSPPSLQFTSAAGRVVLMALLVAVMTVFRPALAAGPHAAGGVEVPRTHDLAADAVRVRKDGVPIMLLVTQTYCGFCETLKEEVIQPMILSGDYEGRILIREMLFDDSRLVRDFDGHEKDPGDIARRYQAWLTPTLVFLDSDGRQLVENIRGINTLDFYAYYVDEAIAVARDRLTAGRD